MAKCDENVDRMIWTAEDVSIVTKKNPIQPVPCFKECPCLNNDTKYLEDFRSETTAKLEPPRGEAERLRLFLDRTSYGMYEH